VLSLSTQHRQITEFIQFFFQNFFFFFFFSILVVDLGYVFVGLLPLTGILFIPRTTDKFVCNTSDLIPGRHGKNKHILGETLSRDNVSVTKTKRKAL
jgi:uncharacterized membrane protein YccF (DUF307 family)